MYVITISPLFGADNSRKPGNMIVFLSIEQQRRIRIVAHGMITARRHKRHLGTQECIFLLFRKQKTLLLVLSDCPEFLFVSQEPSSLLSFLQMSLVSAFLTR